MADSEMVARVARALFKQGILEHNDDDKWGELEEATQGLFVARARAAIGAMREPTETMIRAAGEGCFCDCDYMETLGAQGNAKDWRAMIDAALAPT